jgi:hypothetical protein
MKNFKRVEKFSFKGTFFKLYIDKNDSVYDVVQSTVTSWKKIGNKSIPNETTEVRDNNFFNLVKGNPTKIAINQILARLELYNF